MNAVPEKYRGLWRRRVFESAGQTDNCSTVYWLQTADLFADVRIPPDRGRYDQLACMSYAGLRSLARQQGFAGSLQVDGDRLTWNRWVDYQPTVARDVGRVHFEGNLLIEHGEHANYREEWQRVQIAGEDILALTLESEQRPDKNHIQRTGILVAIEGFFMIALARPAPLPVASDLLSLIEDDQYSLETKRGFLDCTVELGIRNDGDGWELQVSTISHHEGLEFEQVHGNWRRSGAQYYVQTSPDGTRRRWRVLERGRGFQGLTSSK